MVKREERMVIQVRGESGQVRGEDGHASERREWSRESGRERVVK